MSMSSAGGVWLRLTGLLIARMGHRPRCWEASLTSDISLLAKARTDLCYLHTAWT